MSTCTRETSSLPSSSSWPSLPHTATHCNKLQGTCEANGLPSSPSWPSFPRPHPTIFPSVLVTRVWSDLRMNAGIYVSIQIIVTKSVLDAGVLITWASIHVTREYSEMMLVRMNASMYVSICTCHQICTCRQSTCHLRVCIHHESMIWSEGSILNYTSLLQKSPMKETIFYERDL